MPLPITRGNPRDWRVAKQSATSSVALRRRTIINEQKPCSCPGCEKRRSGVSRYCGPHHDLTSKYGDPVARIPTANELLIFKHAVGIYLKTDPELADRIAGDLKALERRMFLPASYKLGYADMHPKLPRVAKAKGLLANWLHAGATYTEAVTHALALAGWIDVYFDGLWENRQAFLETRSGALMGNISLTIAGRTMSKRISGAVWRSLGRDFHRHATTIYGGDFWSSPVSTQDGHSMTLRDYTKLALRAAGLLGDTRHTPHH